LTLALVEPNHLNRLRQVARQDVIRCQNLPKPYMCNHGVNLQTHLADPHQVNNLEQGLLPSSRLLQGTRSRLNVTFAQLPGCCCETNCIRLQQEELPTPFASTLAQLESRIDRISSIDLITLALLQLSTLSSTFDTYYIGKVVLAGASSRYTRWRRPWKQPRRYRMRICRLRRHWCGTYIHAWGRGLQAKGED
jgi:hypothetical protein